MTLLILKVVILCFYQVILCDRMFPSIFYVCSECVFCLIRNKNFCSIGFTSRSQAQGNTLEFVLQNRNYSKTEDAKTHFILCELPHGSLIAIKLHELKPRSVSEDGPQFHSSLLFPFGSLC